MSAFVTVDTRTSTAANAFQRGPSIVIASLHRTTDRARRSLLPSTHVRQPQQTPSSEVHTSVFATVDKQNWDTFGPNEF